MSRKSKYDDFAEILCMTLLDTIYRCENCGEISVFDTDAFNHGQETTHNVTAKASLKKVKQ